MFGEVIQTQSLRKGKNRHLNSSPSIANTNSSGTAAKWRREMRFRTSLQNTV
jgi:hypothetical protein